MIDDPQTTHEPRIPRDAFEENLYREYIGNVLRRWEGLPGLGNVLIHVSADREVGGIDPQRDGRFGLSITQHTKGASVAANFFGKQIRGECWLEPSYAEQLPRVWYHLPAQPGLVFEEAVTNYAPDGPPVIVWEEVEG